MMGAGNIVKGSCDLGAPTEHLGGFAHNLPSVLSS